MLSNCLNAKKKWKAKYTIQHRIERSQTTKCIQYNIHETKSYESPNCIRKGAKVPLCVGWFITR